MPESCERWFAYDAWANDEVYERLRACDPCPPRTVDRLAHIVAAQRLWLSRMRSRRSTLAVWPTLTLDDIGRHLGELRNEWPAYLNSAEATGTRLIEYVNSKGESWTSTVSDVLMHVVVHGSYHRGQINAALRDAGYEPVYTDLIHATRENLLPGV